MSEPVATEGQEGQAPAIDFDQHLDAFKAHLASKGQIVLTAEEKQREINEAVKGTHTNYESEIAKIIGKPKPDGVGGIEWLKKDLAPKSEAPATEKPAAPKPASENPDKTEDDIKASQLKMVQDELNTLKSNVEKEKSDAISKTVNIGLRSSLRGITQWGDDAAVAATKQSTAETAIRAKYDLALDAEDNLILYDKGTKNVKLDPTTQQPMTVDGVVKSEFGWMLVSEKPVPTKISGTGTKSSSVEKTIDGKTGIIAPTIEAIKTEAKERGLIKGSEKFNDFYFASIKASGLKDE